MAESDEYVILEVEVEKGPVGSESVWALPEGPGLYRVRNIPLFSELNHKDLVRAEPEHAGDEHDLPRVRFAGIFEPSGHETLVIALADDVAGEERRRLATEFGAAGCGVETGIAGFLGLDVPPGERESVLYLVEAIAAAARDRGVLRAAGGE